MFLSHSEDFQAWRFAQEIVWEKHNGSGFHADRFRRVHEFATHWYQGDWAHLTKNVQTTSDSSSRTVRRKAKPAHLGRIGDHSYESVDGGPRMMRSVIFAPSEHGNAVHPTQKPVAILLPIIEYSTNRGDFVLDPFMGSGSTLVAAKLCGRNAVGVEVNEQYCEAAAKRLEQGSFDLGAPAVSI
jgi:site-specific DNA-methyltransferase (adenine-specific)